MGFTTSVAEARIRCRHGIRAGSARSTRLAAYTRWLEAERGLSFAGYQELWAWSVDDLEAFWASIWDYFGVQGSRPYDRVLGRREMPGAEWFPGAELSYAEHVFRGTRRRRGRDRARLRAAAARPS